MKVGISTNHNVASRALCLKQNGIDFVFRYYSRTTHQSEKRLTLPEAEAISAAGLELAIYEDSPTSLDYFSNSRGWVSTMTINTAVSIFRTVTSS